MKGTLSELSLVAKPAPEPDAIGRPGMSNAELQLDASESGGEAHVELHAGRLDLPGVFAQHEVPLDVLDAHLSWKIERDAAGAAPRISAKVTNATFANADAKGELSATWRTGPGSGFGRGARYPGLLELDGRLSRRRRCASRALPAARPARGRAQLHGRRGARRDDRERDLPRPRRPCGFSVPRREGGARRRASHRGQVRRTDLRLHPGRRSGAAGRARRSARDLAAAHRSIGRDRRRPLDDRHQGNEGAARQRRVERDPGPDRRARQPAAARDRRHRARPAQRHAALHRRHADRPLDRQGARPRERDRIGRPEPRARGAVDAARRDDGARHARARRATTSG